MKRAKRVLAAGLLAAAMAGTVPHPGGRALAGDGLPGREVMVRGSPIKGLLADTVPTDAAGEGILAAGEPGDSDIPEELEKELEEELAGDASEDDLDRMIEDYFSGIESGAGGEEAEMVADPDLLLEKETDGRIRYTLPNGNYFITTVPRGMVSSQPVDVFLSGGIVGVLKKDDVLDVMPDSWHFTEPGNYHIKMLSYQPASGSSDNYNVYEVNYYFTVINGIDGRLGAIPAPEGFVITGVRLDGQPLPLENERCFFLEEDGRYEIRYADVHEGNILPETVFVHDTMAPFLSFSKETEGRETEGPLEFYPSEPDCRISLSYNGDRGYAVGNVLDAAGNYELCVEDDAGNRRSYYLYIRQTYDLLDMRLILAGGVILAVLIVRLVFLRRNMKVI